jgi:hypothetical protein
LLTSSRTVLSRGGRKNRFRKLGFIDYNSRIRVHKSRMNVFLRD